MATTTILPRVDRDISQEHLYKVKRQVEGITEDILVNRQSIFQHDARVSTRLEMAYMSKSHCHRNVHIQVNRLSLLW